jgi:putative redox protein
VHGDDDSAAGAKAENFPFPCRGSRVVPPWRESGRDFFERSIRLEGNLGDEERAQLMQAANMCPVGQTLGLNADIRTNDNVGVGPATSYDADLSELPIPNIYPD